MVDYIYAFHAKSYDLYPSILGTMELNCWIVDLAELNPSALELSTFA